MSLGPLIHVGYHKTGSTWLQSQMFSNSQSQFVIPVGRRHELEELIVQPHPLDFDADNARRVLRPPVEHAIKNSKIPVITSERLSGVPNWGGYDSAEMARRLRAVFPEGKILIIIREQVAMILSVYNQYVRGGGACSLADFLNIGKRPGGYPIFRFDHFRYDRLIAYYGSLFGAENVLALPYEMLRQTPGEFAANIEDFAGATTRGTYNFSAEPKSSYGPFAVSILRWMGPFLYRTVDNGFSPFQMPLARYTGYVHKKYLMPNLYRPLGNYILKKTLMTRWRQLVEQSIQGLYEASNKRTGELIGVDLGKYGYRN